MKKRYRGVVVNFTMRHKELYDWVRKYADLNGYSLSHVIREMIKESRKRMEKANNNG